MRPWARITNGKEQKRRLPFLLIALALFSVLAASCAVVARLGSHSITVTAWDRVVSLDTSAHTVKDALAEANIVLGPNDYCNPGPESVLTQGLEIKVVRASIAFVYDGGKARAIETAESTVSGVLSQASISVGVNDTVVPNPSDPIPSSGRIRVVRVTYAEVTEDANISYTIERRDDSSLEAGLVRVYSNGVEGVARVTYRVKYEDGAEVSRQETSREQIKDPSPQVLLVGSLKEVSRGGSDIRFDRAIEVVASAYCPCEICCGPNATGITSSGIPAGPGVIAVDPRVIPMGSRVYVDGYGFAVAGDTGSAIKGNRIDVCFETHDEALRWGMQRVKVYVIE